MWVAHISTLLNKYHGHTHRHFKSGRMSTTEINKRKSTASRWPIYRVYVVSWFHQFIFSCTQTKTCTHSKDCKWTFISEQFNNRDKQLKSFLTKIRFALNITMQSQKPTHNILKQTLYFVSTGVTEGHGFS